MKTAWRRNALLTGSLALGVGYAGVGAAVAGKHHRRAVGYAPTGYVVATEYVTALPTEYVTVAPTAYYVPTVYATTAYSPLYAETAYGVALACECAAVEAMPTVMSYVPSAFYDAPVVASDPCDTAPAASTAVYAVPGEYPPTPGKSPGVSPPAGTTPSSAVAPPTSLNSTPAAGRGATPPTPQPTSKQTPAASGAAGAAPSRVGASPSGTGTARPGDSGLPAPPTAPAAEKDANPPPSTPAARPPIPEAGTGGLPEPAPVRPAFEPTPLSPSPDANKPVPPKAPGETTPLELPPKAADETETYRRDVRRPVLSAVNRSRPAPAYARSAENGTLNVLEGTVVRAEDRQPEGGVGLTVESKTRAFTNRRAVTDAFGHYQVRLPDGDWTVKVATPGGRTVAVSELTVSNGQITDDQGRSIPTLIINR